LVPLIVAMVFVTIPHAFWSQQRWWLACYFLFLLTDAASLHPYQFVWFNEAARFFASERNYETDYWGYFMREAAIRARELQGPMDLLVSTYEHANPSHLITRIFTAERFSGMSEMLPPGTSYLLVTSHE
jgi:hypothetical protein